MAELELTHEQEITARMCRAFREAVEQGHRSAFVTIHVGQEVWRVLKAEGEVDTYFGFPLVLEPKWATEHIRVCSGKDIP